MNDTKKKLCIHGHFYQPPRENPWLESIEQQESAHPYHDWNARITAECYAPNGAARILDGEGRITKIVNNYSKISFNFGPTLLGWMETHAPRAYESILEADRQSMKRFSGHGSALAQAYNHMIMPLANKRDCATQVIWGIRDFEHRFGRRPEGMWLPETAVDIETLEALAEQEIRFTILAPHQARRIRRLDTADGEAGSEASSEGKGDEWIDVSDASIDPKRAYLQRLPSGREIVLFFYDGPISRAVAFEKLLERGERFVDRLMGAFNQTSDDVQMMHIATDGETYGHHHRHGEMALAYALEQVEERDDVELTNYGEFLEHYPPQWEVEIVEDTSWSCIHGVERWTADCGCNSGGRPGWNQSWRGPLRHALDRLRDRVCGLYVEHAADLFDNPWAARDDYIEVILSRTEDNIDSFFKYNARRSLSEEQKIRALKLLELQRHAMLIYTSCGWFFDELSGIETVQVIQYAGRVVQLAHELFPEKAPSIEDEFLTELEKSPSNLPEFKNGRHIYEEFVRPSMLDLKRVAAHYAVISLFDSQPEESRIYSYLVENEDRTMQESGAVRMVTGCGRVRSRVTKESLSFVYGALHLGDHNVTGGCLVGDGEHPDTAVIDELNREAVEVFERAEFPDLIRLIDRAFSGQTFTLRSLFRDEQRRVVDQILDPAVSDARASYRQLYQHRAPLLRFLADLGLRQPEAFRAAATITINNELQGLLSAEDLDIDRIQALLREAAMANVALEETSLSFAAQENVERRAEALREAPQDHERLKALEQMVSVAADLPFEVPSWVAQNVWYTVAKLREHPANPEWHESFRNLGDMLSMSLESLEL